jgi:hypothetical protein
MTASAETIFNAAGGEAEDSGLSCHPLNIENVAEITGEKKIIISRCSGVAAEPGVGFIKERFSGAGEGSGSVGGWC